MKRETIEQQAKSYTLAVFDELEDFSDVTQAYIDGAEWMQETMIDKACEWLEEKNKMYMYELEMILGKQFINDFKKAMEE